MPARTWRSPALQIAVVYLAFSAVWILLSDAVLEALVPDPVVAAEMQSA